MAQNAESLLPEQEVVDKVDNRSKDKIGEGEGKTPQKVHEGQAVVTFPSVAEVFYNPGKTHRIHQ